MPEIDRPWFGGYIRVDARGRDVYVIRKSINGTRYEISTRCNTQRAAMKQYERFEADPENYEPQGNPKREPLYLTERLAQEFLDWSRDEKKNSEQWRWTQRWCLKWWGAKLQNIDLRGGMNMLVQHINPALDAEPKNRAHRIRVLKAFYGWLRKKKHLVAPHEDPTLDALPAPQPRPEQWRRDKVIPLDHFKKVRPLLDEHWRDAMDVQAGTGWHVTETIRFAEAGEVQPYPGKDKNVAGVLVCPRAKGGGPVRTGVSAKVLKAAKRLRQRGTMTRKNYVLAIRAACKEAGVAVFTPGRFRHTVSTFAVNQGEDEGLVSSFLNHQDKKTTKRFYSTHATPKKVPTPI